MKAAEYVALAVLIAVFGLLEAGINITSKPEEFGIVPASTPQPTLGIVVPTPGRFIGPPIGLLEAAQQWLGVPYLWGGCSHRGVDCSCFYLNVLATIGITVPRTTTSQIAAFTPIPRGEERLGDAVFFDNTCRDCGANPTHVGMVIGGGLMIDAGDPVQIESYQSGGWQSHNPRFGRPRGL